MSGPIVRKYGFPNFEKIFGEQKMKHGVDEGGQTDPAADKAPPPDPSHSASPDETSKAKAVPGASEPRS